MPKKRRTPRGRSAKPPRKSPAPKSRPAPTKPRKTAPKPRRAGLLKLSPQQIRDRLDRQHARAAELRQQRKAEGARNKYRPGKRARGSLIMVSETGRPVQRGKGKKGFLVYVTTTGKKQLVHGVGKNKWKARKITDAAPPYKPNLKKAVAKFERARLEITAKGRTVTKAGRKVLGLPGTKKATKKLPPAEFVNTGAIGGWDFTPRVSTKIAKSIKKTLEGQASHRSFLVTAMVLFDTPNGPQTAEFSIPIDKPDHIAIALGGMQNFVRQAFYAKLARELAHLGYVTAGSANHVRLLGDNAGLPREEWLDRRGDAWAGRDLETVTMQSIEWKIEQSTN